MLQAFVEAVAQHYARQPDAIALFVISANTQSNNTVCAGSDAQLSAAHPATWG
jgi:hypothetical protein